MLCELHAGGGVGEVRCDHFDMLGPKGQLGASGIYRIVGKRLTVCFGKRANRPDDFTARKGSGRQLMVLTRK